MHPLSRQTQERARIAPAQSRSRELRGGEAELRLSGPLPRIGLIAGAPGSTDNADQILRQADVLDQYGVTNIEQA